MKELSRREQRRKERMAFYNTRRWKDMRDYMRQKYPLCQDCLKEGKITPAEETHHILSPFVRGLSCEEKERRGYSEDNLVCLCKQCHINRHHPGGTVKDKIEKYK